MKIKNNDYKKHKSEATLPSKENNNYFNGELNAYDYNYDFCDENYQVKKMSIKKIKYA